MKTKHLQIFIIISIIFLAIPILLFVINFNSQSISDIQKDWADFGTFISGLLTPILSILSLVILIYISVLVQKLSSEENHRLFRLQRRIQAYDDLLSFMPELNSLDLKLEQANMIFDSKLLQTSLEKISKAIEEVKSVLDWFTKYHFFLKNFYPRYGHLFAQEVNNSTYKVLVNNSRTILDGLQKYYIR